MVDGKVAELKVGDTNAAAGLVQPKEGPTGPSVKHLERWIEVTYRPGLRTVI